MSLLNFFVIFYYSIWEYKKIILHFILFLYYLNSLLFEIWSPVFPSPTTPFNPKFSATVHPLNSYQSFPQIGVNQKTSKRKPDLFKFVCVIDIQLRKRGGWVVFPLILTKIFMACIYFETLFILSRPQSHRPCFNIW